MSGQDCEQLTLFPVGSRANHSPLPGSTEARKMTVTSGRRCYELYGSCTRLGSLARMCLESSIWHSTRCLLTWKAKATPAKRLLFQLAVSMPRTKGTECVFWPTPSTGAALCGGTGSFKTLERMAASGLITEEERRQLSQGNGGKTNPQLLEWLMGYEQQFTKLIPTPTSTDYKGGCLSRYWTSSSQTVHAEREREAWVQPQLAGAGGSHSPWENWLPEPRVGRVVDGIPNRVDRIKCLGNAVVPQQFYLFFKLIADIEKGESNARND